MPKVGESTKTKSKVVRIIVYGAFALTADTVAIRWIRDERPGHKGFQEKTKDDLKKQILH